jgi:predicted alpha-1,2-mannosidase
VLTTKQITAVPPFVTDGIAIEFNHYGGYYHRDSHINAFSHTHMASAGVSDWGNVGVMPYAGGTPDNMLIQNHNYRSAFSKETEVMHPGFYGVHLDTVDTDAELTVSGPFSGMHRYSYPAGNARALLVDVCHTVTPASKNPCVTGDVQFDKLVQGGATISGHVQNMGSYTRRNGRGVDVYFTLSIRAPGGKVQSYGTWADRLVQPSQNSSSSNSGSLGAYVSFDGKDQRWLEVEVGISFLSVEAARRNLNQELAGRSFNNVKADAINTWQTLLQKVMLPPDANPVDLRKYYTALYHASTAPTRYDEQDGTYLKFDQTEAKFTAGTHYYSDLSLWDTFRTQQPWLVFLFPEVGLDVVRSLVQMGKDNGDIPRWPIANMFTGGMFGDNANQVIEDAFAKGLSDFDVEAAYDLMRLSAFENRPNVAREGIEDYLELGYVPDDFDGSEGQNGEGGPALTLAYAYNDWALGKVATRLNKTEDAQLLSQRAGNYRNVYSRARQFMCARPRNGPVSCPPGDLVNLPYYFIEGNVWHYTWDVPHDPVGLMNLFPSPEAYAAKLEANFEQSREVIFFFVSFCTALSQSASFSIYFPRFFFYLSQVGPVFATQGVPNPFYW